MTFCHWFEHRPRDSSHKSTGKHLNPIRMLPLASESKPWDQLLAVPPTTVAGISEVLAYVGKWQSEHDAANADVGDLLTAIRSAVAAINEHEAV